MITSFFERLWANFARMPAPVIPTPGALTTAPPAAEAREPVNDQDVVRYQERIRRRKAAMNIVEGHANAYVYRDYGNGTVILHDAAPNIRAGDAEILPGGLDEALTHLHDTEVVEEGDGYVVTAP